MRADRHTCASNSLESKRLSERAGGHSCEKSNQLVFGSSVLRERLRRRSRIFLRGRATGHVCATVAFASLLARRVRQDARCRWKPQRRDKHRQRECEQDGSCVAH